MKTRHTRLTLALAAALLTASLCHAQTFTATAPAPAPDPSAQQSLSTAANTNGTSTYNAGVAYYDQQAYEAAAQTAQNISDQDAANVGSGYGGGMGYSDAWQQAAVQAQGVADQNQAQADNQTPIQQQSEASQTSSAQTETAAAPAVASANSTAAQSASNSGSSQSFADIGAQTGVPQGQVTVSNDTAEYLVAGAATQALMNGVSTDGYSANVAAYQAAQNAAACSGWNAGCAAFWWAVNASQQARANADYAANTAAAPVLGSALNVAAAASAIKSASQTLQQIQSMTGVSQGQTAGATSVQQAQALTTAGTGVAQGQPQIGTDTSYTTAADTQQSDLGAATQQNQDAAVTAAQAWQTGLSALYSRNAAQNIAAYDNTMAQTTGDPDWTSAAQIAQQQVDQQGTTYDAQSVIQNQAIAAGNSSGAAANAIAPGIGNTLNTAASSLATSQAQTTLQGIAAQTGVPQNQ